MAAALVVATAAGAARDARAQCPTSSAALTLDDGMGFAWDVSLSGTVIDGSLGAFDHAMRVAVNGTAFPDLPYVTELDGRQVVMGPWSVAGLRIRRKIFVPDDQGWARFLTRIENPNATSIAVSLEVASNLGTDATTAVVASPAPGSTTFSVGDRWVITDDPTDGTGRPAVAHNLFGPLALAEPSAGGVTVFNCSGSEGIRAQFDLILPAGTTLSIMTFVLQRTTRGEAEIAASNLDRLPAAALQGLSGVELREIVNWHVHPIDLDTDADGIADTVDNCPTIANPSQADSDLDGVGNACDPLRSDDTDADGIYDAADNCLDVFNPGQEDGDSDGIGDACDASDTDDLDGDGVSNPEDNCPFIENAAQADGDHDGVGDACDASDPDYDADGIADVGDNCPWIENGDQIDSDGDGVGDDCDGRDDRDIDGDGIDNTLDGCPFIADPGQEDSDGDGRGDACDTRDDDDLDGDGIPNDGDNCPLQPNPDQSDSDDDGNGDRCDGAISDLDRDRIPDAVDNCPFDYDPYQTDRDGDGVGAVCDEDDNPGGGCTAARPGSIGALVALLIASLLAGRLRRRRTRHIFGS